MNSFLALLQDGEDAGGWLAPLLDFLTRLDMRGVPGARETAWNWLLLGLVVVVLVTGAMQFAKWRMKERAIGGGKIWRLPQLFAFLLVGLPVILFLLLLIAYFNLDFWTIVGFIGVFKGALLSWAFYFLCMVGCDLIFPWSRTDYGLR